MDENEKTPDRAREIVQPALKPEEIERAPKEPAREELPATSPAPVIPSDDQAQVVPADDQAQVVPTVPVNVPEKKESEYIREAEKIISEYEGNPHIEDEKEKELSVDYLEKKFHKKIEKND